MVEPLDAQQVEELVPVVYEHLRSLARRYLSDHPGHTLRPTALVHEAWMKLEPSALDERFEGREHYLAVAARAMRQILVDRARARRRLKRGGDPVRTTLSGLAGDEQDVDVLDLHRALEALEARDPRGARVVELRYFGGLSADEIGRWLKISPRTVQTSWRLSRAFLVQQLTG